MPFLIRLIGASGLESNSGEIDPHLTHREQLLHVDFGELDHRGQHHADHFHHERQVERVDAVTHRVVVGVEALVGELFRNEHSLVAVVEEAGVVAAVLHGMVVRVEHVEVQPVALGVLRQLHHEAVRIGVGIVMHVDTIARTIAVRNHVRFDHADDTDAGFLRDNVGVGVAAVETLLFTAEVADAHGAAGLHLRELLGDFEHAGGAGTVVVSAASRVFAAPRITRGGIEVRAKEKNLLGVLRALELGDDVAQSATAHLVVVTHGLHADAGVELFDVGDSQVEVLVVGVARLDLDALTTEHERLFTREVADGLDDAVGADGCQDGSDSRVGGGGGGVDARANLSGGTLHFSAVELATERTFVLVVVVLAVVNGAERGRVVKTTANEFSNKPDEKQGDEPKNDVVRHNDSPSVFGLSELVLEEHAEPR